MPKPHQWTPRWRFRSLRVLRDRTLYPLLNIATGPPTRPLGLPHAPLCSDLLVYTHARPRAALRSFSSVHQPQPSSRPLFVCSPASAYRRLFSWLLICRPPPAQVSRTHPARTTPPCWSPPSSRATSSHTTRWAAPSSAASRKKVSAWPASSFLAPRPRWPQAGPAPPAPPSVPASPSPRGPRATSPRSSAASRLAGTSTSTPPPSPPPSP